LSALGLAAQAQGSLNLEPDGSGGSKGQPQSPGGRPIKLSPHNQSYTRQRSVMLCASDHFRKGLPALIVGRWRSISPAICQFR